LGGALGTLNRSWRYAPAHSGGVCSGGEEYQDGIRQACCIGFLLNQTANCDIGPIGLPRLTQAPSNGTIEMRIALSNVPAVGTCAARQVPTIALVYVPKADFIGTDAVTIAVEIRGRDVQNRYQITVQ